MEWSATLGAFRSRLALPPTEAMILAITALCVGGLLEVDQVAGPYFEIQDAVDAAVSGDVIRVAPGDYQGFVIDSKSLMVVGEDSSAPPLVIGPVQIVDLEAVESVTLSGLRLGRIDGASGITVSDCVGSVRFQDMMVGTAFGQLPMSIVDCDDVSLHRCNLRGGFGGWTGLLCQSSNVALFSSQFFGGVARRGNYGPAGIRLMDSSAVAMDCALVGGDGAEQFGGGLASCIDATDGGPGAYLIGSVLEQLGGSAEGGSGGLGWFDCGGPGDPGPEIQLANGGILVPVAGIAPTLDCPEWVQLGDTFSVTVEGDPLDAALLLFGVDAGRTQVPGATGNLLLGGPPFRLRRLGISSGTAVIPVTVPTSPFFFGETWHFQSAHVRGGALLFGPVRTLAVL